MIYSLYIINKSGGLAYQREFEGSIHPKWSSNDYLIIASTFQSVHALATQISPFESTKLQSSVNSKKNHPNLPTLFEPYPAGSGILNLDCDNFKLYCHQTLTGLE